MKYKIFIFNSENKSSRIQDSGCKNFSLSVSISILFGKLFFLLLFSLHRGIGVAHSQRSDHYLQNNNDSAIADVYAIYLYVDVDNYA
ncbi:hypothetical protein DERF_000162 [Dermatophagoides farinae]|uniref:Uncharacterized protein n=1 Tax=Dermatophagoides farinae TaxID=6954 RepID=A0A922L8D8_DERFA|nr:hypothetical protein DERF_000162 [Dermatophagoides farinae]